MFITPPQPHIEAIMQNVSETFPEAKKSKLFDFSQGWKIKLVGIRLSDKNISKTKFDFEYLPEDFYGESTENKVQSLIKSIFSEPCKFLTSFSSIYIDL